ncbi:Hypothetical predicted protein [Mytilus galloprovincialis]|uniref:DUF4371 domain-containing protein n=1 Tax=Mytilus galloprovincialis TaxID=29158 RepID=A0A8B6DU94_MYTGA|nr:Hypothetical predicted protein [Mytilus galloprovincialis]
MDKYLIKKRKTVTAESTDNMDPVISKTHEEASCSDSQDSETNPNTKTQTQTQSLDPVGFIGKSLNDTLKSTILGSKWTPEKGKFSFPLTHDSAFCAPCIAFGECKSSGGYSDKFSSSGMKDWKNAVGAKRGTFLIHQESSGHKDALLKSSNFLQIIEGGEKNIKCSISKAYEDNIKKNQQIILNIIDVIVVMGQRNIPLRGHNWDKDAKREDGNFDFFVHWKAEDKPVLKQHLATAAYNAKYLSPDIQNEIIAIAGDEVLEVILSRARCAKWFSIMADECTDVANLEQMAVCIRFVDVKSIVNEDFIGFVPLDKVDAASISTALLKIMEDCKLDLRNLRGQGYDGASVMSGLKSGVSARIKELQPRAEYHHCRAHALNLVISSSCRSVDMIRTVFDDVNQLTWFLGGSPKRTAILKRHLPDAKQVDYLVGDTDDEKVESNINIANAFSKSLLPKLCVKQDGLLELTHCPLFWLNTRQFLHLLKM